MLQQRSKSCVLQLRPSSPTYIFLKNISNVCVCVCVREREREREIFGTQVWSLFLTYIQGNRDTRDQITSISVNGNWRTHFALIPPNYSYGRNSPRRRKETPAPPLQHSGSSPGAPFLLFSGGSAHSISKDLCTWNCRMEWLTQAPERQRVLQHGPASSTVAEPSSGSALGAENSEHQRREARYKLI